jgi:hypothetical protein
MLTSERAPSGLTSRLGKARRQPRIVSPPRGARPPGLLTVLARFRPIPTSGAEPYTGGL